MSAATLLVDQTQTLGLLSLQILFQGPHVKMGIYRGRPTGVSPHVTTGRADYFGPFVNRSVQHTDVALACCLKLSFMSRQANMC